MSSPGPGPGADRPEHATLTPDDLVTGEAVALDLPAASLATRMVAGLLDVLVAGALLVVLALLGRVATAGTDAALATVAAVGAVVAALVVLPTAQETLTRGRTLGKRAMGLRTVRDDGGPISFQHAFTRALVGVVEIYALTGAPAFFSGLLSERGKRLGDHAAGTTVVRDRVRLRLLPPAPMPPGLTAWAGAADIAPLPVHLAIAVRQVLTRGATLEPTSRDRLLADLAERVAPFVAPSPPPGTPPADLLAAVAASRRARDGERLRRDDALRARLTGRRN